LTFEHYCNELKLPYLKENHEILIKEAAKTKQSYSDFLKEILENEYLLRQQNRTARRIREAKFPHKCHLEQFDKTVYDEKYHAQFAELETLDFIDKKQNLILMGTTGAGKTFYASCLGLEACMKGKTVLFLTIPDLIIRLRESMSMNQIKVLESRFLRYDLIILDEFGYFSFDPEVAEVFFALWSSRHMKGSTIVTTNLNFDEWVKPLNDAKIASALVGRLCEKSYVIELEREIDGRLQNTLNWHNKRSII